MPRVPTQDAFRVAPNTLPQVQFSQPNAPDIAGQQAQQLGQAMGQAGQQATRIAMDMQQQANDLRTTEALNKLKEQALRMTYDKDVGYTNLRGANALERPDGKPLADEYTEQLQKQADEIAASLGNDAQRAAFSANAAGVLGGFRGNVMQHESREFETYALSVSEGVQSTALRELGPGWPILVLSAVLPEEDRYLADYDLTAAVSSPEEVDRFNELGRRTGRRLPFPPDELPRLPPAPALLGRNRPRRARA